MKRAEDLIVPDIWYKSKRVLRTTLTTLVTLLPLIPQIIAIIQGQWGAEWLSAIAVQAVAINAALTAIIALPTVNAWLTKIGFGSVPKSALVDVPVVKPSGQVVRVPTVKTDPRAIAPMPAGARGVTPNDVPGGSVG